MTIAEMTPGATNKTALNWQRRITSKIRTTVRTKRAFGMRIEQCHRHHLARQREHDAVAILAELAGVDWLYNPNTGEVRFFEGN